jgi:EF hand domain-containing protein
MIRSLLLAGLALTAALVWPASVPAQTKPPRETDDFRDMLFAIMKSEMGPTDGWFRPGETRYGWDFVKRFDDNKDRAVTANELDVSDAAFDRLDRDGDGRLTAGDFDWSESNPLNAKTAMARAFLSRGDRDRDGKLSAEEWATLFERFGKGEENLDLESLRKLLFPPAPPRPKGKPADMPSTLTLLQGLYSGEIGSPFPGPRLDDFAPDFTLPFHDGSGSMNLRSFRGKKPVALIFGSFT